MNSLRDDQRLMALLDQLHGQSDAQETVMRAYLADEGARSTVGTPDELAAGRAFWRDKFVALERDKASFCYTLCRALRARCIIEAGTSYGVSTLYLAAAVRDNGGGTVIGTEYEPAKVAIARANFAAAGLAAHIDLREGDLRETLKIINEPVDFLLLDIWTPMATPVIQLVAKHLRQGAIVVADNTARHRTNYRDLFAFLEDPANGFITQTLPFNGGLEMSVKL
jgi:predicted O-methyltransferase YrrM